MKKITALFLLAAISFCSSLICAPKSMAQAVPTVDEEEMRERAKKRLYPGGRDEEPLIVQTQINRLSRKQVETPEETTPATLDND